MNLIVAMLVAELLKIETMKQLNVQEVNAVVAQAEAGQCTQWCDLPMANPQGIVAPTSSVPVPTLEVLPVGAMYNVFNQPKF
jgi:hypothetical protein